MSLFGDIKVANSAFEIARILANAAKVLTDSTSSEAEKSDARKAKAAGDKKMSEKNPNKMYNGGMAHGKMHMYLGGSSSVKDNAGLRALKASGPRGMEAYKKITGRNA